MMNNRQLNLPIGQLYDSRYSPIQARYNYTKSIQQIHSQLKKKKLEELKKLKEEEKRRQKELEIYQGKYKRLFWKIWSLTFARLGEEWVILAILGICVAIISYSVDKGIAMCLKGQMWLYHLGNNLFAKWVAWISLPVCLILWDVGLTHLVAPQAAGSGIPQLKTSLRGVIMKEVLTFKVLVVKWLGLAASIGSGIPLGKEGPLIHCACIIVTKLSKLLSNINKIYINESKTIEMLGAAWAVGVACTFNAPIGGVLFSVEITTAYYAVRNYWRGFFGAVWGATTYRLLLVWIDGAETITAVFKTNFFVDYPYNATELLSFAILGLICGLLGSSYIFCKQIYDRWANNNAFVKKIKKTNRFIYPTIVIFVVSTITWPPGSGQFIASDIGSGPQVLNLFSNFSWTNENISVAQQATLSHWTTPWTNVYVHLVAYFFFQFIGSILGASLPIPAGTFIPIFRAGAAVGRIGGELMHTWFPCGTDASRNILAIMPGAYSTVGAAALAGAVTHTMSVCVILFEMTSSIAHVIPVLIAVLIANGVARFLTPSVYDLVIQSKKLPYLPDLLPNTSAIYEVYVEDFMITDIKYVYLGMNYINLRDLLIQKKKITVFPLVDSPQTMTLLGSVPRSELIRLLDHQMGAANRRQILPSPRVFRRDENEEPIEIIPMRKKSHMPIDDSSDSDKEDDEKDKRTNGKIADFKMEKRDEIKKIDIPTIVTPVDKKVEGGKISRDSGRKRPSPLHIPKSPLPERRSPLFHRSLESPRSLGSLNSLGVPNITISDTSPTDGKTWDDLHLKHNVEFTNCHIDPAPFQLVERTSLLKVHSLFSMLAINSAYVTSIGKLVGVVTLKELRQAIEDANSGDPPKRQRVHDIPLSPLPQHLSPEIPKPETPKAETPTSDPKNIV